MLGNGKKQPQWSMSCSTAERRCGGADESAGHRIMIIMMVLTRTHAHRDVDVGVGADLLAGQGHGYVQMLVQDAEAV